MACNEVFPSITKVDVNVYPLFVAHNEKFIRIELVTVSVHIEVKITGCHRHIARVCKSQRRKYDNFFFFAFFKCGGVRFCCKT